MDEIAVSPPARLSPRDARPRRGDRAAWTGACVLAAGTAVALAPPAFGLWLLTAHDGTNWRANHASHVAAAHLALLMVLVPAGGAAAAGLATLLSRRRPSAAERVRTMCGGAFLASLMLTIGGVAWVISHAQLTG
jgi:nitrate reductase gamma subunit